MGKVILSLKFMHNMERFATQVYRTQRNAFAEKEISDRFKIAADNEQQHVDDLKKRIAELNGSSPWLGFIFQIAGRVVGFITKIFSKLMILKADVWVEKRAIKDYSFFLRKVKFDEKTATLIKKIIKDEEWHVDTLHNSIEILKA